MQGKSGSLKQPQCSLTHYKFILTDQGLQLSSTAALELSAPTLTTLNSHDVQTVQKGLNKTVSNTSHKTLISDIILQTKKHDLYLSFSISMSRSRVSNSRRVRIKSIIAGVGFLSILQYTCIKAKK